MKKYDEMCQSNKGYKFVVTQKGKEKCASLRHKEVGQQIESDNYIPLHWVEYGYAEEIAIPEWRTDLVGYEVVYYHNGYRLHAGNPQTFPLKRVAEAYKRHYESRPWFDDELFIEEVTYEGIPLPEPTLFHNGKEVIDQDHYFGLDCNSVGDYFTEDMVMDFIDMLPPACYRSDCSQIGEPENHKLDEVTGKERPTYATFKKIAENVWEYCGDCFKGENEIRGKEIPYVR